MGINSRDGNVNLENTPGISGFSGASVRQTIYTNVTSTATTSTTISYPVNLTIPKGTLQPKGAFRIILAGTKTLTNNTMRVTLYLEDEAILTLTSGWSTALDWVADMTVTADTTLSQVAWGTLMATAVDPIFDNAVGDEEIIATDFVLKAGIACTHASDTCTCLYARVEYLAPPQ